MELTVEGLTKHYGEVHALENLSLAINAGEIFGLLGPSGCGKTTALRLIAGLEEATQGRVLFRDEDLTNLPSEKRNFGVVFQSYALFPHMTVAENVAFGLRARGVSRAEREARVARALEMVRLSGKGTRAIHELSGGEQQRVALARGIVIEPRALLLDEPLSSLDVALREETRQQIREVVRTLGITTVFVTHDQEEAFDLCDRIAVLSGGRLQQVGTPSQLYNWPANLFVAGFVGKTNVVAARVAVAGKHLVCELPGGRKVIARSLAGADMAPEQFVKLSIRPEELRIAEHKPLQPSGDEANGAFPAILEDVRELGSIVRYEVRIDDVRLFITEPRTARQYPLKIGQMCEVRMPEEGVIAFAAGA